MDENRIDPKYQETGFKVNLPKQVFEWKKFFMGAGILFSPSVVIIVLILLADIRAMYGLVTIVLIVIYVPIPAIVGTVLWATFKKGKRSLGLGFLTGGILPFVLVLVGSLILFGTCGVVALQ